ncbi:hypothetical protein ACVNVA_000891 [Campylobacter upsaliensis]
MMKNNVSQLDLIMEFFKANEKRDIKHPEVVDWVVKEWQKRTGKVFRDPRIGVLGVCTKKAICKRLQREFIVMTQIL